MKYFDDYTIDDESWEKQSEAGRYNPAQEITYEMNGKEYTNTLSAGTRDSITVMISKDEEHYIYVLTENSGLDYMGLQIFYEGEERGDMFLQSVSQYKDEYGKWDIFNMHDRKKLTFLMGLIC